ncbi:MAG: MGMT family protein [Patescibacteria group bacterium]
MKAYNYTLTKTDKGISVLDIVPNKVKGAEVINFETPELYAFDMQGTPFQQKVWKALLKIKKGQTKTYSQVAEMIGMPTAVRAVASAIARNNIAILIPCHRVIRSDGKIGEYRWGSQMKRDLLQSEGIQV